MSVIRVGTNQQYAAGWDNVFGKVAGKGRAKKAAKKVAAVKRAKPAATKKAKRK